jgi:hypothetical protein
MDDPPRVRDPPQMVAEALDGARCQAIGPIVHGHADARRRVVEHGPELERPISQSGDERLCCDLSAEHRTRIADASRPACGSPMEIQFRHALGNEVRHPIEILMLGRRREIPPGLSQKIAESRRSVHLYSEMQDVRNIADHVLELGAPVPSM